MKILLVLIVATSVGLISVSTHLVKNENNGKRLIKTSEKEPAKWLTENEIFQLIEEKRGFMDITDFNYDNIKIHTTRIKTIPSSLRFNATVQELITKLDSTRVDQFLSHFSSYYDRRYNSATGRESQQWLLSQVEEIVEDYVGSIEVIEINHGYRQRSIVARLNGSDQNLKNEVVILGAHLDSTASGRAPGADDNGSGSVAILETLRAIVEAGLVLKRTVEFHFYAAEEVGLRGSQAIAESYRLNDVHVIGMLNLDIVGYHVPGVDKIAIYTDYGNDELAQLMRILTDGYLEFGRIDRTCGYACSDHGSWDRNGFPAIFVAEAIDTPFMHSSGDTIATVDINQINEFIKLTIGYAVQTWLRVLTRAGEKGL